MYKISIIIPVYNTGNVLKATIESIVNQTIGFQDIELILVNDGSTDKSGLIMDEYSSKYDNVKSIHLNKNCGSPGRPRNIGIAESNAPYVMFLDSDDQYSNDACEYLYNAIIEENADIAGGMMSMKQKNGEYSVPIHSWISILDKTNDNYQTRKKRVEKKLLSDELYKLKLSSIDDNPKMITDFGFTTKLFKKSFLIEHNILFPEDLNGGEDAVFLFNSLINANGIVFINKIVYYYDTQRDDKDNGSLTHNTSLKTIESRPKSYNLMYNLSKANDKKEMFITELLHTKLTYWFNSHLFHASNLTNDEILNILKSNKLLFEECINYNVNIDDFFVNLFNDIKNDNYDVVMNKINEKRTSLSKFLITIIIPIKKNTLYIYDILNSIFNLNLNFENIEIIFVDCGLTDEDNRTILKEITTRHDNIKSIFLNENPNFKGNRFNLAILNSTSEYLVFLKEDEVILCNTFDKLYDLINDSDFDIVSFKSHDANSSEDNNLHIFRKEFILKNNIQFESNNYFLSSFISKCFDYSNKHKFITYNPNNRNNFKMINSILDYRIELDFNEIDGFDFPIDIPFELHINYNKIVYSFIIKFSSKNKNLICFGPGAHARDATNSKGKLLRPPYYDRWSWYKYFDESFIAYSDPIFLYDEKITLGWFVGDENQWYLETLSKIIKKLSHCQNILHENILFFGSSGGGFSSVGLGTLIKGSKVLINNSQFFIMNYRKYHVENLMGILKQRFNESSVEKIVKLLNYRLDVVELFKREKYIPKITYYLNLESDHDVNCQYVPLVNELSKLDLYNDELNVKFYREVKDVPHNPLATQKTINIIKLFCKQNLFNEVINNKVVDVYHIENSKNKNLIIEKSKLECNKEYGIILENKLTEFYNQLLNSRNRVEALEGDLLNSRNRVETLILEKSNIQSNLDLIVSNNKSLSIKYQKLLECNFILSNQIENHLKEIIELKNINNSLIESKCWKITKPLRTVNNLIK